MTGTGSMGQAGNAGATDVGSGYVARTALFGFPDGQVRLRMSYRPPAQRAIRAGGFVGGGILAAPLLALIPPHIPWLVGAVGAGLFLAGRTWRGEYVVHDVDGACPRCGKQLRIKVGSTIRFPADVDCFDCHQAVMLDSLAPAGGER